MTRPTALQPRGPSYQKVDGEKGKDKNDVETVRGNSSEYDESESGMKGPRGNATDLMR